MKNASQVNTIDAEEAQALLNDPEMLSYAKAWDHFVGRLGKLQPYLYPLGDIQFLLHQRERIALLSKQVLFNRS